MSLAKKAMSYYLYIIRSGNTQYVGIAKDISNRLKRHNVGDNRSTKHRDDWRLVYFERFNNVGEARRRELEIKKGKKGCGRAKNLHRRGVAQPG